MTNIFKTDYSFGKSILNFSPSEDGDEKSVFFIAKALGLTEVFVLDENMSGFAEGYFQAEKEGISLRYGSLLKHGEDKDNTSQFGVFALNTQGYKDLVKLYSKQETSDKKFLSSEEISQGWSENLWMVVPFYDSFLFRNLFEGKTCVFDMSKKPTLFIEDNDLPFDSILKQKVLSLASNEGLDTLEVQSCYYPNEDYFDAWQTLKAMGNRGPNGANLGRPNIDHCGSTNFYPKSK